jgi:putative spermidine/putrescine transport system permease protein
MAARAYNTALTVALLISAVLFLAPQILFLRVSFFESLGMGLTGDTLTMLNYSTVLSDRFYLDVFLRTLWISVAATLVGLVVAYPTAYWLARLESRALRSLIVLLLITSFVSIVVKVLGLTLILGSQGPFGVALRWIGAEAYVGMLLNSNLAVVIGLVQYSLPMLVILLFGVIQTIPRSLEEAAAVHGATDWRLFTRLLLPLTANGVRTAGLIVFNMNMGAFTSAVLLGGGKVLTVPVVIQRKIILEVEYPTAAVLAVVLTVAVMALNFVAMAMQRRASRMPLQAGAA